MEPTIEYYRGDSWPISLLLKNKLTGTPIDLTSCSFKLTVTSDKNPSDATTKLFDTVGIIDADPTTGLVAFIPEETDTDLPPGTYYYDVEFIDALSNKRTILKNKFKIIQDNTKT